jgi:hypothetical protein
MLDLRYDPVARTGYVKLRPGRSVRTRSLSAQANAEYDRRGQLLSIAITELDATAAEFLRTSDEETLLRVIAAQAGAGKAGFRRGGRPPDGHDGPAARPKPRPRPKPAAKPKPAPEPAAQPAASADGESRAAPKKRRRRRSRGGARNPEGGAAPPAAEGSEAPTE